MKQIPIPLANPDFDQGFYQYQDIGELTIALGWEPWWIQGNSEQVREGYYKRPEYKPEPNRTLTGTGQKLFTTFATHDAGLQQQVQVPIHAPLILSAQVQYWSLHTDGSGGGYALQVGIDPTGGINPKSQSVVWGAWRGQDDRPPWDGKTWKTVTVEAVAQASLATIYLHGACRHRAKHNDGYFENVRMWASIEEPEPGPGPNPDQGPLIAALEALTETLETNRETMQQLNDRLYDVFRIA